MKASITIDLDTLNDYANTYGIKYNVYPDPVYTVAVPRLLKLLDKYNIKATFFVVGRNLNIPSHFAIIKSIVKKGHEIANHTQNHHHNFEKLSFKEQEKEITDCHNIVRNKLKINMRGFRAPGYNINSGSFKVLSKLNYYYDSSLFPTTLLPILKMAIIIKSNGRYKSKGGGNLKIAFAKTSPELLNKYKLVELPISITPVIRLPFMGTFNIVTGKNILKCSYWQIKLFKRNINYEIHPIEFLDYKKDKIPQVFERHPGIKVTLKNKTEIYNLLFTSIKNNYTIHKLKDVAKTYL